EILAVGSRILLLREIAAKKLGCEELVLLEAVQAPAIRERPDVRVPTVAAGLPEFVRVNERPFRHEQRSGLHSIRLDHVFYGDPADLERDSGSGRGKGQPEDRDDPRRAREARDPIGDP